MMLLWYPYEGPLMPIYEAIFEDLVAKGHEVKHSHIFSLFS